MAQAITRTQFIVCEDALALETPGSNGGQVRVRKGSIVNVTHKYQNAVYGSLEKNGSMVWLEDKVVQVLSSFTEATEESKEEAEGKQSRTRGRTQSKSSSRVAEQEQAPEQAKGAIAVHKFDPRSQKVPNGLHLQKGDQLEVFGQNESWFFGLNLRTGQTGIFPTTFVRIVSSEEMLAAEQEKEYAAKQQKKPAKNSSKKTENSQIPPEASHSIEKSAVDAVASEILTARTVSKNYEQKVAEALEIIGDAEGDEGWSSKNSMGSVNSEKSSSGASQASSQVGGHSADQSYMHSESLSLREKGEPVIVEPAPAQVVTAVRRPSVMKVVESAIVAPQALGAKEEQSRVKPLRELCQSFILEHFGSDPVIKAVMGNFRAHCSRSFANFVLREFETRRQRSNLEMMRVQRLFNEQLEEEHGILLNEIDRLSSDAKYVTLSERIAELERIVQSKDKTISQYQERVRDLQERVVSSENESWLKDSLSFLKTPSDWTARSTSSRSAMS